MAEKTPVIFISRDAARRFTRYCWEINDTPYWFHQTLTFGNRMYRKSVPLATARLNNHLDWLRRAYPDAACLWGRDYTQREGVHFHVIILFWGERPASPETFHRELRQRVWEHWERLNRLKSKQVANRMTLPPYRAQSVKSFGYLAKLVRVAPKGQPTDRPDVLWWGKMNDSLIQANSTPKPKKEISAALKLLFPTKRNRTQQRPARPIDILVTEG